MKLLHKLKKALSLSKDNVIILDNIGSTVKEYKNTSVHRSEMFIYHIKQELNIKYHYQVETYCWILNRCYVMTYCTNLKIEDYNGRLTKEQELDIFKYTLMNDNKLVITSDIRNERLRKIMLNLRFKYRKDSYPITDEFTVITNIPRYTELKMMNTKNKNSLILTFPNIISLPDIKTTT